MISYNAVTEDILSKLAEIVGEQNLVTDADDLKVYGSDETENICVPPEAVVKPETKEQVVEICRLCTEHRIPLTVRGGGTSLSGGSVPLFRGVVLSTERMNRIIEIDARNMTATVQPGLITYELHQAVEKLGLYYPPDPASRESCTIGGNLSHNAGGPACVKYGVTRDWIAGVEWVTPTGKIMRGGGKLRKNVTGYPLKELVIGSEGTLAVITEITVKLIPKPTHERSLLAIFGSLDTAAKLVAKIMEAGITPCALEFMERKAIETSIEHLEAEISLPDCEGLLLIRLDGFSEEEVSEQAERIMVLLADEEDLFDLLMADTPRKEEELWKVRRAIGEAVKKIGFYREEDTVVPRTEIPEVVRHVRSVVSEFDVQTIIYGHAGDGNLHVNVIKSPDVSDERWAEVKPKISRAIFEKVVALGGQISGEHGVGVTQIDNLPLGIDEPQIELMRKIKKLFDPAWILNPGKVFKED